MLNPDYGHEKEYEVKTLHDIPDDFKEKMEAGVDIGDYTTKPCRVTVIAKNRFLIVLSEGKKHQIRRMCGAFGQSAIKLKRVRVMNIKIGDLRPGEYRPIEGAELKEFLARLGFK